MASLPGCRGRPAGDPLDFDVNETLHRIHCTRTEIDLFARKKVGRYFDYLGILRSKVGSKSLTIVYKRNVKLNRASLGEHLFADAARQIVGPLVVSFSVRIERVSLVETLAAIRVIADKLLFTLKKGN